jgi:electron transport complex protein RnfG
MNALAKKMLLSAALLGLFAVAGTSLVALTYEGTAAQIAENERQALLRNLHSLIPPERHDNDVFADRIEVLAPEALGSKTPVTVYRARRGKIPVAAVLTPVAPDGYGGDIRLLVAVEYDGRLAGVRVMGHKETPGLGDRMEAEKSDWILGFSGLSLGNPPADKWKVKKDGGVFDQFTGATITPRAVVAAVSRTLHYYEEHREELFEREGNGHAEDDDAHEEHEDE